ncbi:MAG: hypothetical protein ACK4WH_08730 [Phycisphaerales bacterium]
MSGLLVLIFSFLLAQAASPPPYNDAEHGTREEAIALLTAMDINDQSLASLVWEQTNSRLDGDTWVLVEKSSRALESTRWRCEQTTYLLDEEGTPFPTSDVYVFDGLALHTLNPRSQSGIVRELSPADLSMWSTPLKFMGRYLDQARQRRLAELLLTSDELRVRAGPEDVLRVVSGYVEIGSHAFFLEVTIDTSRGFAPLEIRLYDGLLRRAVETMEVSKLESRSGVWIPTEGVDTHYFLNPAEDDKRWPALQDQLRRLTPEGDLVPSDTALRRSVKQAINELYGQAGVPVSRLSPPHRLSVTKISSVNQVMPASTFQPPRPDGAVIIDGFRLKGSNGESVLINP